MTTRALPRTGLAAFLTGKLNASTVALFSLTVLVPSAVFLWLWVRFALSLPPLNADFLAIYCVSILLARRGLSKASAVFAVGGTALALGLQTFFGLGFIYIDNPALIREYLGFVSVWPWRLISFYLGLAAVLLVILYAFVRRIDIARARVAPALVLLAVLIIADFLGANPASHRFVGSNLLTSSAVRSWKLGYALATKPGFTSQEIASPMMRDDAARLASSGASVMSIAVEAYGAALDPAYNAFVLNGLLKTVGSRYDVTIGRHAAKGGTLTGEMRELCSLRTAGTPTHENSQSIAPHCLPHMLKTSGYQTLGLHGNSDVFYNRKDLYPSLGFDRALFLSQLAAPPYSGARCRHVAFEGVCDRSVLDTAVAFVGGGQRRYAHVMTLDTHFPLAESSPGDSSCAGVAGTRSPDLCLYANQLSKALTTIGNALMASPNGPDYVFLFGDHPPPYAVAEDRNFFSHDSVPYLILTKKK